MRLTALLRRCLHEQLSNQLKHGLKPVLYHFELCFGSSNMTLKGALTLMPQFELAAAAYRLLPMGSHPRVADKRGTYDLFGPVNKLWGGGYDKAMSVFLACLKEFGDFARAR